jgi:hypothetical protein
MGSSVSPSTKQNANPPPEYQAASRKALELAGQVAKMGYIPYQGVDIAGFVPQQISGMQGAANDFAAWNQPGQAPVDVAASLPNYVTDPSSGITGSRSFPGYQAEMDRLQATYPGLANYFKSMFIDPVTGTDTDFWKTNILSKKASKKQQKRSTTVG